MIVYMCITVWVSWRPCISAPPAVPLFLGGGKSEAYRLIMLSRNEGRRLVLPRNTRAHRRRTHRNISKGTHLLYFPRPKPFLLPGRGHEGRTLFKLAFNVSTFIEIIIWETTQNQLEQHSNAQKGKGTNWPGAQILIYCEKRYSRRILAPLPCNC